MKKILIASMVGLVSIALLGFVANAQVSKGKSPNKSTQGKTAPTENKAKETKSPEKKMEKKQTTLTGTVSNPTATSLTVTAGDKVYTINVDQNTKVVNRVFKKINLTDIKSDDKVQVEGMMSDSTLQASRVRDLSLPLAKKSATTPSPGKGTKK